jgi:hypothetical protein
VTPYDAKHLLGVAREIKDAIKNPEVPTIIADNVFAYARRTMHENPGTLLEELFHINVAPPFERFFIEANNPFEDEFPQHGWDCRAIKKGSEETCLIPKEMREQDWEWIIRLRAVVALPKTTQVCVPGETLFVRVAADGSHINHSLSVWGGVGAEMSPETVASCMFGSAIVTISFMNCRNVELTDVTEGEGPTKKWLKRRRQKGIVYRTVEIDSEKPRRSRSTSSREGVTEKTCPFHIRRGRFVTYTDANKSKGMFGRGIYGTFWVPAHTVGDKKNGQTITTYNVKAPA